MLDRIIDQSDNAGATDCDRALSYLAVRYDQIYSLAAEQIANNASFTGIDCLPSPVSGTRKIVDVVFSFTDRTTDVVSKLSPYYDRRSRFPKCIPGLVRSRERLNLWRKK